tara:strand:+ start:132 stop:377 length:246 start_codon:yes stop_codon:yes gene_type:complete
MIDKPTRIGNLELYNARVLNMSTAKWAGVQEEYNKEVVKAREANKEQLKKHGEKAELKLYYSLRKKLWNLLEKKIEEKNND